MEESSREERKQELAILRLAEQETKERRKRIRSALQKEDALTAEEEEFLKLHPTQVEVERASLSSRQGKKAQDEERRAEMEDSEPELKRKVSELAKMITAASHVVVYTGAGLSTAAHIPDYRGPQGVWTLQKKGQTATMPLAYEETRPTDAHMALRALLRGKRVHHIISQNVDGLHVRSGVPAAQLSELHGNIYHERCPSCAQLFLRHFHVTQSSSYHHHDTERACGAKRCKGACLRDTIVYFGEKLDDATLERARAESEEADVAIFLGTSLRVLQHYKFIWAQQRGRRKQIVIVNLQWTPKDKVADLKINGRCDAVLARLLATLRLKPPPYSLKDDPIARLEKAAGGRPDSGAAAPERGAPKSRAFPTVVRRQPAGDDFVPATGGYKEEACAADEDAQAAAAGDGPEAEASEGATEPTPTTRRRTRA